MTLSITRPDALADETRAIGDLLVELSRRLDRLAERPIPEALRSQIDDDFSKLSRNAAKPFYDAAAAMES